MGKSKQLYQEKQEAIDEAIELARDVLQDEVLYPEEVIYLLENMQEENKHTVILTTETIEWLKSMCRSVLNNDIDHDCRRTDPEGACMFCYQAQEAIDQLSKTY